MESRVTELDLHGESHGDVDRLVENFIYLNQYKFPINIICGNSILMLQRVLHATQRIGCETSMHRYGTLTVHRFK
jgi:hypothetical protein